MKALKKYVRCQVSADRLAGADQEPDICCAAPVRRGNDTTDGEGRGR